MSQKIVIVLIVFFSAILQTATFSNFLSLGLGPDILLLLVIFWTIQEGFEKAMRKNILAGFLLDLITFYSVGIHVISFVLVAFFVGLISKRFLVLATGWRVLILSLTIIFGTFANSLFLNGLFLIAKYFNQANIGDMPVYFFSGITLKGVALNILFFPLIYFSLKLVEKAGFLRAQTRIF